MRKRLISLVMGLLLVFTVGCSSKKSEMSTPQEYAGSSSLEGGTKDFASSSNNSVKGNGTTTTQPTATSDKSTADQDKIIYTGDIQIVVEDLKLSASDIRENVNQFGGYIESERLTESSSNVKIRVPSDKLQDFIKYLDGKYQVKVKNLNTQNVTDVYVDNEARIKNLKAQEAQILEIMKKANTVEEILKVQNELSRVRGDIESLESRKKVWDKDISFSAVTVNSYLKATAVENKLNALNGSEFGRAIGNGFKTSTTVLILCVQWIIVFLISNIIILAILVGGVFFIYRKYKRKNKKVK
jgi:hypothetical protein